MNRPCFKTITAFFLALILALSAAGPVRAAEEKPEPISFSYLNAAETGDNTAVCYYSDDYFLHSGLNADAHLRTMSLAMAMSAFERFTDNEDYRNGCRNFNDLMIKCGFSGLAHNAAFDKKPTEDSIGLAAASKKLNVFGTDYTLIALGIRGAGYGAEWAANLRIGPAGQAEGFAGARNQTLAFLSKYEKEQGITGRVKLWICGYSRGGAVANLTAAALNRYPGPYHLTPDDIYCYTFEAPQGDEAARTGQYRNIHNTISPVDVVPLIPSSDWGLTRAGFTRPGSDSRDDLILPEPGSREYEEQKPAMLKYLHDIDPDLEYVIDSFSEVRFTLFRRDSEESAAQSGFIRDFVIWFNSLLPEKSRQSYAENFQDAFSTLGRIFPGAKKTQIAKLPDAMRSAAHDPEFYAFAAAAAGCIRLRGILDEESYVSALKTCADNLGENLVFHMKEAGVGLSEEDYAAFIDCLYPVIIFMDNSIMDDIFNCGGVHLATILSNTEQFLQAHCPDIVLAWLQIYDSYYE